MRWKPLWMGWSETTGRQYRVRSGPGGMWQAATTDGMEIAREPSETEAKMACEHADAEDLQAPLPPPEAAPVAEEPKKGRKK